MNSDEKVRLNKYISATGFCSRRKADEWIASGKVKVNGMIAEMGAKVSDEDEITIMDKPLKKREAFKLVAFYKPEGYSVTFYGGDKSSVFHNFSLDRDLRYVGRLDKDSEGLLLLTNDGDLCNEIAKAQNRHEKEYIVTINHDINQDFLEQMARGVPIEDKNKGRRVITRPCQIKAIDKRTFSIILTQGYNRQIRRMCEYFDYRVVKLSRIRVMNITLEGLTPGKFKNATDEEIRVLKNMCMKKV